MEGLFRRIDVYVSLHRAEGFGLTLAEAMLRRKPVIATGYSGNVDFMNDTCARLVKYEIVETDRAYSPYPRGTRWAEPNVEHAASLMRSLFQNPGLRQELGNRAKQHVLAKLSPAVVGRRVRALIFREEQPAATATGAHSAALPAAE
jgi:glycosyltransferase involved in cell wall biosynthesis